MATIDATGRFLLTPEEPAQAGKFREVLQVQRGLIARPEPELDAFALELAHAAADLTGAHTLPFAMVNLIGPGQQQYFAGLHVPAEPGGKIPDVARAMQRDLGFCVHALDRGEALVLEDITEIARYATNSVVDGVGVRTYLGAPLIDADTGVPYGTICVLDTQPRRWGRAGLDLINGFRDRLSHRLDARRTPEQ
jgi:GAF domain-containing protein